MVSVAGPWPAVVAAAGGSGLASSDGTRQQRQLTRSVIVWYERYSASLWSSKALSKHMLVTSSLVATELRLLNELPQVYLTEKCVFDRGNGRALQTSGVPSAVSCAVASS